MCNIPSSPHPPPLIFTGNEHHRKDYPKEYSTRAWLEVVSPYFLKTDGARLVKEVKTIAASVGPEELPAKLEELRKMKSI